MDGSYIPEHTPWEFEEDTFMPMPWIPEGSLVSESRFYEVRRAQRPKSYSPPQTPSASHDVPPLDALPFPAIIPSSTEGPTLRRAVSFHPGGSQRLRREALVIDGEVTADMGHMPMSYSREFIVPSSSEPNNIDLIARQLDAGSQSGLERLKTSMLRLIKAQSQRRRPTVIEGESHSEVRLRAAAADKAENPVAEATTSNPLAVRRGLPIPSTLKLVSNRPIPLVSPYHPDIPTSFQATTLLEATGSSLIATVNKHKSIDVEDMCTNLRSLVSPIISTPCGREEIRSSQSYQLATDPMIASDDTGNGIPRAPIEDWNFASELEGTYGDNPFSYFDGQERMPSFIRPLSVIPDIVTESTQIQRCSASSATLVSTFPEPPAGNLVVPPIPRITISRGGPVAENLTTQARLSFSSSAPISGQDLVDSADEDDIHTCATTNSTDVSPRSSEDKDEPLAIRRLTLLAQSSAAVDNFPSAWNLQPSPSLAQGTFKPVAKIVRFSPEAEEHIYLADPVATYPPPNRQRPRSSSVPPPQKGSLRNQTFHQRDECEDGRLSRSQLITFPSRIPKKRTLTKIGRSGRHTAISQKSTEALSLGGREYLAPTGLEHANEDRKRLSSMIPVPGLKVSSALPPLDCETTAGGKRVTGRNSKLYISLKQPSRTPTPQPAKPHQKTPLATSWSMTLRQYVKGGDTSDGKRQVPHPPFPRRQGEIRLLPVSSVGMKDDRKSSLPVKKASFFRDGIRKVTSVEANNRADVRRRGLGEDDHAEGETIGSVDKTGGIGYIAPPKARATLQSRGNVKDERQGYPTAGAKTLRPMQIRNFLGRLAA